MASRKRTEWMADAPVGSEWFDALQLAADTTCEVVPEGWLTVREIAAQVGMSEGHTWRRLRMLVDGAKAEARDFRIRTGKTVRSVTHYRLDRCE